MGKVFSLDKITREGVCIDCLDKCLECKRSIPEDAKTYLCVSCEPHFENKKNPAACVPIIFPLAAPCKTNEYETLVNNSDGDS